MQKIKESRVLSFVIVALIYIVSTIGALLIYPLLPLPWWASMLIVDILATIFVFLFSLLFENASVYDPYWSVQPIVIILAFSIGKQLTILRALLLVAVLFWGIRLTANWAYTFGNLTHQDWRYTMLKEKTGRLYPIINFLGIHLVPTLVVYLCCIPIGYAFQNDIKANTWSIIFIGISIFAVILQGTADVQMHKYRRNRKTPFIREGLWKFSRHPNYLGEILMWWGIGFSVFMTDARPWLVLTGALANTALFMLVSIPMADKRQSRKEGFLEYKAETNKLLPLPKPSMRK
jgi:steroid 5-alpha reductase family enzyme